MLLATKCWPGLSVFHYTDRSFFPVSPKEALYSLYFDFWFFIFVLLLFFFFSLSRVFSRSFLPLLPLLTPTNCGGRYVHFSTIKLSHLHPTCRTSKLCRDQQKTNFNSYYRSCFFLSYMSTCSSCVQQNIESSRFSQVGARFYFGNLLLLLKNILCRARVKLKWRLCERRCLMWVLRGHSRQSARGLVDRPDGSWHLVNDIAS